MDSMGRRPGKREDSGFSWRLTCPWHGSVHVHYDLPEALARTRVEPRTEDKDTRTELVTRLPFCATVETGHGQVWHDCTRRTWHGLGEGTPRFLAECLHGQAPCRPPLGGLAIHAGRNAGFGTCHVVVLVQDLATRRTRGAESLRSTITLENVHGALRQHLAPRERARFLDWIAANVPYQQLRRWFDNRASSTITGAKRSWTAGRPSTPEHESELPRQKRRSARVASSAVQ